MPPRSLETKPRGRCGERIHFPHSPFRVVEGTTSQDVASPICRRGRTPDRWPCLHLPRRPPSELVNEARRDSKKGGRRGCMRSWCARGGVPKPGLSVGGLDGRGRDRVLSSGLPQVERGAGTSPQDLGLSHRDPWAVSGPPRIRACGDFPSGEHNSALRPISAAAEPLLAGAGLLGFGAGREDGRAEFF